MHWKVKAHTLALLSRVPGGRKAYHLLQRSLGSHRLDPPEYVRRALEIVEMIREVGRDPQQGTYFEIGTGWRPFLPFILYLVGAEKIISVDVNPWLNQGYTFETYQALGSQLQTIAQRLGIDVSFLKERYEPASEAKSLSALLDAFHVDYRYPGDARKTGLPDASVDFVCSSNVFQHVPPDILADIHKEAFRILQPGGLAVHRFGPGDHYSHVDRSITAVHFLRFSERQWHWLGGSGLAYQNRLRAIQHQQLLEQAGFSVLTSRVRIDAPSLEAITTGRQPIHEDFAGFTPEELAASQMWLVGTRPRK
jgi:SAM-dependent methyltransferase